MNSTILCQNLFRWMTSIGLTSCMLVVTTDSMAGPGNCSPSPLEDTPEIMMESHAGLKIDLSLLLNTLLSADLLRIRIAENGASASEGEKEIPSEAP